MKRILYFITLNLFIISCQSNSGSDQNSPDDKGERTAVTTKALQPEQLHGEWQILSMIITKAYNTAESTIEEFKEEDWEKKLEIKPIRTHYNVDGTYTSEYRGLDNVIHSTSSGTWEIKQDSVALNQTDPDELNATYQVQFQSGNIATFTGMLDWTKNGEKDDLYAGKQQRISGE